MNAAHFRFYADLNDFLPPQRQESLFATPVYDGRQSVKHLIESAGAPHTEVGLIVVNGRSVNFDYLVQAGDRVSVYPPFASIDISPLVPLRPPISPPHSFVTDYHLGKLARYLRLVGLDTLYLNDAADDPQLAHIAAEESRILLTRDRGLLKRGTVVHGYCLRTLVPEKQLTAVLHRFRLHDELDPWSRCLRCNGLLAPVDKAAILHRLEPKTKLYFDEFHLCGDCGQIYWPGSHVAHLQAIVDAARGVKG